MKIISLSQNRSQYIFIGLLLVVGSIGLCASSGVSQAVIDRSDYFTILGWVDTVLLKQTEVARYYHDMGRKHNQELYEIFRDSSLAEMARVWHVFDLWIPNFRGLRNGHGTTTIITREQLEALEESLRWLADNGSASLHDDIIQEMRRLQLEDFIGMSMTEAWEHLHAIWGVEAPSITIPPAPTPEPTVNPRQVLTPEGTLESGEYAGYWVEYRNTVSGYGFTYPADWILMKMEQYSPLYFLLRLCDREVDYFGIDRVEGICIFLVEEQLRIPASTFEQAIFERFCNPDLDIQCDPITIRSDIPGRPIRAELQYTPLFYENRPTAFAVFFKSTPEKLTYFYSTLEIMQTREAQAVVDSYVWGEDTPIIAPNFRPSAGVQ